MRACPVSDRCFALDSSSRCLSFTSEVAKAAAPSPLNASVVLPHSIESGFTRGSLRDHDARTEMLRVFEQEDLNFLLTNRIPRRLLTRFMGWFSRIEQPLVRDLSIGLWRFFSDLDLTEAKKADFRSMHDCFTRELKDGARPVDADPSILVSPCDAIVGAGGAIAGTELFQVKGFPYTLQDLLGRPSLDGDHMQRLLSSRCG